VLQIQRATNLKENKQAGAKKRKLYGDVINGKE
jgi:hypothetical protein